MTTKKFEKSGVAEDIESMREYHSESSTVLTRAAPSSLVNSSYATQDFRRPSRLYSHYRTGRNFMISVDGEVAERAIEKGECEVVRESDLTMTVSAAARIIKEDIYEHVIVVPEMEIQEEMTDKDIPVKHKIVEFRRKADDTEEIEYVERIVEVPEVVYRDRIKEVPKIIYKENIKEVPKIITKERVVEVPQYEYVDVPYERIVEVPEIREQIIRKEVAVPQYVEKIVNEYVDVSEKYDIIRNIPVGVEAHALYVYSVPKVVPRVKKVAFPLYVPRFLEVPVPMSLLDPLTVEEIRTFNAHLLAVTEEKSISLCEVETIAAAVRQADIFNKIGNINFLEHVAKQWNAAFVDQIPLIRNFDNSLQISH